MNPETHRFEALDTPQALESATRKGWKIFQQGEEVIVKDTKFRVVDIQPGKLTLRPSSKADDLGIPFVDTLGNLQTKLAAAASPEDPTPHQTIGWAIKQMHNGAKVQRCGWNGKGMFLFLVPGSRFKVNRAPLNTIYPEGTEIDYCPHVDMRTADGRIVPWLASQTDLLAVDWQVVD